MANWNDHRTHVSMPLMAPGGKLSEVEFLKLLGAWQWDAISHALDVPLQSIVSEQNERLYASFINLELDFGAHHSQERFGEGAKLFVGSRVGLYAQRFAEGLFVFDDREIPPAELEGLRGLDDLRAQGRAYAYYTNAFIVRAGGNSQLKVFKPRGVERVADPLREEPTGIRDHARVQSTGEIAGFGDDAPGAVPLRAVRDDPVRYAIVAESDLNGAGLLYFARYVAMMNYAERVFAEERLPVPLSNALVAALSTDRRRLYYFANATPKDAVDAYVQATVLPPGSFPQAAAGGPYRTPFKLLVRMDLYRVSDRTLMASSLVQRSLNVPANAKAVLTEAERFLGRVVRTGSR